MFMPVSFHYPAIYSSKSQNYEYVKNLVLSLIAAVYHMIPIFCMAFDALDGIVDRAYFINV